MSDYRINQTFDLMGGFWTPDQPDAPFEGTLTSGSGRVELIAAPEYVSQLGSEAFRDAFLSINNPSKPERIPVLYGATSDGLCTLINSLVLHDQRGSTNLPFGYQISATRLIPARTVMGLHIASADSKTIESADCCFSKLHYLLPKLWDTQPRDEVYICSTYGV
jgi:hypothetical protein